MLILRIIAFVDNSKPFLPKLLIYRVLLCVSTILVCSSLCNANYVLLTYVFLYVFIVLLHSTLTTVTEETRIYYKKTLLLISVDGDSNDDEDRYLNGYADIKMNKAGK